MTVSDYVNAICNEYFNDKKEDIKMANEFNFGAYNTNSIRMSLYGMAIKNKAGKWVAYDK